MDQTVGERHPLRGTRRGAGSVRIAQRPLFDGGLLYERILGADGRTLRVGAICGTAATAKTALAIHLALAAARRGGPVLFFSLDDGAPAIGERMRLQGADEDVLRRIDLHDHATGSWDAASINDRVWSMRTRAAQPPGLVVIDPIDGLPPAPDSAMGAPRTPGRVAGVLARAAVETRTPVLLIAGRPTLLGGQPAPAPTADDLHAVVALKRDEQDAYVAIFAKAGDGLGPAGLYIPYSLDDTLAVCEPDRR